MQHGQLNGISGLNLTDALISLQKRGKTAEASKLKQRVIAHFKDILSEEQIMQLPLTELTGTIEIFNSLYPEKKPETETSPLEAHISELKNRGHVVIYGAAYHGKR